MLEAIWRYPLKSAQGESLQSLFFGDDGPELDRAWACVTEDGTVVSAKHPRRWGRLLYVTAGVECTPAGPVVMVHVPGHEPLRAGDVETDRVVSKWLGARVHLTRDVPADARLDRWWPAEPGMVPDWAQDAGPGREQTTAIAGSRPGGRFIDFGDVHIVTASALDALQPHDPDVRRFRPNLLLTLDREPAPGEYVQLADDVVLRVLTPTPRCAMPGAAQRDLQAAPDLLRALGARRIDVQGRGRAACFGSYAEVIRPGRLAVGARASIAA